MHYHAWSETWPTSWAVRHEFTEAMFYHFGGMPARQIVERLNKDFGYGLEPEAFAHEKEMNFLKCSPASARCRR